MKQIVLVYITQHNCIYMKTFYLYLTNENLHNLKYTLINVIEISFFMSDLSRI